MTDWESAAAALCGQAQDDGFAAFVIRTTDEGGVRFIGPRLPRELVARMLRSAADGYESQVGSETLN